MAITFDAASNNLNASGSPAAKTVTHSFAAGSDRLLICGVVGEGSGGPPISVTVNGAAMNEAVYVDLDNWGTSGIYYSLDEDVTAGNNIVIVTSSASLSDMHITVASFFGADQAAETFTAISTATGATVSLTHAVTVEDGGMHFDIGQIERPNRDMTLSAGQTVLYNFLVDRQTSVHGYQLHPSGNTSDKTVFASGVGDDMLFLSAAFGAAASGTPVTVNPAAGSITITGKTFTLDRQIATSVDMLKGSVAITGQTFTVTAGTPAYNPFDSDFESYSVMTGPFDGAASYPPAGTLTITGNAFTVTADVGIPVTVSPASGAIAITGKTFTLGRKIATSVDVLPGSVAITGKAFTLIVDSVLLATADVLAGSVAITGKPFTITASGSLPVTVDIQAGTLTITGKTFDAFLIIPTSVSPAAGSVGITGKLFTISTVGAWVKEADTTTSTWSTSTDKTTSTWSASTDKTTSTWVTS